MNTRTTRCSLWQNKVFVFSGNVKDAELWKVYFNILRKVAQPGMYGFVVKNGLIHRQIPLIRFSYIVSLFLFTGKPEQTFPFFVYILLSFVYHPFAAGLEHMLKAALKL